MRTINKHPQLIEKVQGAPMHVIQEIFESDPKHLFYVLRNWACTALISYHHAYEEPEQRRTLLVFSESLQVLLAALDILHSGVTDRECVLYNKNPSPGDEYFEFYLLTREQANNPRQLIESFFDQYTILYIRRELSDWIEAAIDFPGNIAGGITIKHIYSTCKDVLCLTEAAYYLIQEEADK